MGCGTSSNEVAAVQRQLEQVKAENLRLRQEAANAQLEKSRLQEEIAILRSRLEVHLESPGQVSEPCGVVQAETADPSAGGADEAADVQPRAKAVEQSSPEQAEAAVAGGSRPVADAVAFSGLKKGFFNVSPPRDHDAGNGGTTSEDMATRYSYAVAGGQYAKEELGSCMLCLEPLPNDPRQVVNLCSAEPRCLCLLHRRCFLNPQYEMSDALRRCMICKALADPALVRQAVKAREKPIQTGR